ncbi:MAG: hypothetical protein COB81_00360 [Flavobacteriaceae bacterium]|nr:MAG: hypothetical protein COB81_00360 [Flavobacteriaceae bacterium]
MLQITPYNLVKLILFTTVFLCVNKTTAQVSIVENEFTVLPVQSIDFGVFYTVGAGSIEVDYQGNVFVTGGVISLNTSTVTPAIFEIKFCKGSTVTMDYSYSVILDGGNGGKIELIIGPSEKGESGSEFFVGNNCNTISQLRVGAKLIIPANSVASEYYGSFPMTFKQ